MHASIEIWEILRTTFKIPSAKVEPKIISKKHIQPFQNWHVTALGLNFISKPYLEGASYLGTLFPNQTQKKSSETDWLSRVRQTCVEQGTVCKGFYNKKATVNIKNALKKWLEPFFDEVSLLHSLLNDVDEKCLNFPQQQAWYSIIFNGYDCHIDMGSDMVDSRKLGNHQ